MGGRRWSGRNRRGFLGLWRGFRLGGLCYERLSRRCAEIIGDQVQRPPATERTTRPMRRDGVWGRTRRIPMTIRRQHGDSEKKGRYAG